MPIKRPKARSLLIFEREITSFFKKLELYSEGAVNHNVLYYQRLSVARYQDGTFILSQVSRGGFHKELGLVLSRVRTSYSP